MSLEPCILVYFYFIAPHNVSPIQNHTNRMYLCLLYDIFYWNNICSCIDCGNQICKQKPFMDLRFKTFKFAAQLLS